MCLLLMLNWFIILSLSILDLRFFSILTAKSVNLTCVILVLSQYLMRCIHEKDISQVAELIEIINRT